MNSVLAFLVLSVISLAAAQTYVMGKQGDSCANTCHGMNLVCNMHIETGNSLAIFNKLGINCTADTDVWWAHNQPGYVSGKGDPNYGRCLGYIGVPSGVLCGSSFPTMSRLCRCDPPSKLKTTFGTGLSSGAVDGAEQAVFQWVVAAGDVGVMTHFWITLPNPVGDSIKMRYYIDGEANASIAFQPSMACGIGFNDRTAPWGNKWFGKGSMDNGFYLNFRVPFQKKIIITAQDTAGGVHGGFYVIVRGGTNLPLDFGGVAVPSTAKLNLYIVNATFTSAQIVPVATVPAGKSGVHFMHTLAVSSGNMNFLEGCYHLLVGGEPFPGTVLSTGTEDYYDSAWYFNAGAFHLPVSGLTHLNQQGGVTFSAYRFHEMDPITFTDGMQFLWRNGDMVDKSGIKCLIETGGSLAGSPTASQVISYAWVYTWDKK